ncbi:MAG: hypothetical protein ACKVOK_08890 [Flavobacteriales bacterium]
MSFPRFNLALWLFLLLFVRCKKEEDTNPPSIVFELPASGSTYNFGDIIQVKANVKDDVKLDFIRITVTDASNNEYLQIINLTTSSNEKQVQTVLEHNDKYLTSGTYYVRITAGDGTNEFTAFREIQLNELPRALEKILLVKQNTSSFIGIDSLSSEGELMPFLFLNGRYEKGAVDSRFGTFGYAETYYGGIASVDLNSFMVNASIGLPASAENGFYNCVIHDPYNHAIYFGGNESQIRECTNQSVSNIAFVIPEDFVAEHFAINEDFLFVHVRNITSTQQNISVFHRSTGQFFQSLAIDMSTEIMGLHALSNNDQVLVAANSGSECQLVKYNNATNALNDVFTFFDQSTCTGIWPGDEGRFYIAHQDGIVQYNQDIEMISTGIALEPLSLQYDTVNDQVYVVTGNGLYVLNNTATTQIGYYATANCRDVLLQYNK